MKFKFFLILLLILLSVSLVNSAPYIITKICDEAKILAFTTAADSDPEALALRPDGTFVFFEYEVTAPTGASSLLVFNPATSSVSLLAGNAALLSAAQVYEPTLTSVYGPQGLVSDNSGNIYAVIVFMPSYKEYILKITPAGTVSVVIPSANGAEGASDLAINKATNTLYTYIDDYSNPTPPSPLGIHAFSTSLVGGILSASTLVISQLDLANVCSPALSPATALNIYGLAYRPLTNDLIAVDSATVTDSDDFLKITLSPTPSASLFIDSSTVESVTGEIYRVDIAILNDGSLLCTSDSSSGLEGIFKIDSTGTTVTLEANETTILPYVGGTDWETYYSGRAIANDGVNLYVTNTGAGGEGIIKFTYEPPTSVPKGVWEIYQ